MHLRIGAQMQQCTDAPKHKFTHAAVPHCTNVMYRLSRKEHITHPKGQMASLPSHERPMLPRLPPFCASRATLSPSCEVKQAAQQVHATVVSNSALHAFTSLPKIDGHRFSTFQKYK
jgi:hypothetical protein